MKIAVFCSSSEGISPLLIGEAEALGEMLAEEGHQIIYGGATPGCMGALARGAKRKQGVLCGVVPEMDFMEGLVEPSLDQQHPVKTLSGRKEVMLALGERFVVFPGGIGTLDEAFEVLALKSLGSIQKPIIFYNFLNVWSPLLEALELLSVAGLIRESIDELIRVVDKVSDLRDCLRDGI